MHLTTRVYAGLDIQYIQETFSSYSVYTKRARAGKVQDSGIYIYIYIYIPTYSTYMLLLYTHNYGTGVTRVHTRGCHFQPTPDLHGVVRFQCT